MNRKGFTLIELMVVVLIIGILSSIALPQYQKAIKKTRATEAITVGKAILEAEQIYFLENQEYTSNLNQLRVRIPELKNFQTPTVTTSAGGVEITITGENNMEGISFTFNTVRNENNQVSSSVTCSNPQFLPCSPSERMGSGSEASCPL